MKMFFNGEDLGVTVAFIDLQPTAPFRVFEMPVPYRHGSVIERGFRESRTIETDVIVHKQTKSAFESELDAVNRKLDVSQPSELRFDGFLEDRYWKALPLNWIQAERRKMGGVYRLSFIAGDPFAYSVDESTVDEGISGSPAVIEVEVGGSAPSQPIIILKNLSESATTSAISVSNLTGEGSLGWSGELEQDDMLRIDSERMFVHKSTNDGVTWVPVMVDLFTTHTFPSLLPGMQNDIQVLGISNGSVSIVYRDRYL